LKITLYGIPVEIEDIQPNVTYNNCTFGQPQQFQQQSMKKITQDDLIKHIEAKTGFNVEMIERIVSVIYDYIAGAPDDTNN
jgi:hypothetical protein